MGIRFGHRGSSELVAPFLTDNVKMHNFAPDAVKWVGRRGACHRYVVRLDSGVLYFTNHKSRLNQAISSARHGRCKKRGRRT